jgi:hypothetical protein
MSFASYKQLPDGTPPHCVFTPTLDTSDTLADASTSPGTPFFDV